MNRYIGFVVLLVLLSFFALVYTLLFSAGLYWNGISSITITRKNDHNLLKSMHQLKQGDRKSGGQIRVCSQSERKEYVKELCKKLDFKVNETQKTRMVVDRKNKIAFTFIQKAGSTTWKNILLNISSGGLVTKGIPINYQINRTSDIATEAYNGAEIKKYLSGYTKFIVVRNPMLRLVSAFYNKAIKKKFHLKNYTSNLKNKTAVKFSLFHGYLTSIKQENLPGVQDGIDKHWNNFFARSNPCNIDYDYILKLETMPIDMPVFIKEAYKGKVDAKIYQNLHRNVQYTEDNAQGRLIFKTVIEEFKNINKKLVSSIIHKFKLEALIYGYSYDKVSSMAKCGYTINNNDICC